MPRKFLYGPGLPGYGTKGVDGSTGLLGLATYFSAYDGNSDTVTIKSKIIADKELFSNDNLLPGYPERTYQDGDIFIDKNARVFQIDFNEANLYKDTGIFLNTSGFFTAGPVQGAAPEFERYSNAFETEKFLIDTVYTNSVGDYTQYPTTIYENGAEYFANVKYIGSDVVPDFNGYYPFQVWTIGSPNNADSIALTREENSNLWRFGNLDDVGVVRDVSLSLDFADIYSDGVYHGAIDGTITTTNIEIPGWLNIGGDASFNDVYIAGTLYGGSPIVVGDTVRIPSNDLYVGGDVSILDYLYIKHATASNDLRLAPGEINFGTFGTSVIQTASETGDSTGSIYIRTGNPNGTGIYTAGRIRLEPGDGNSNSSSWGGTGGLIEMITGNGGNSTAGGSADGGSGGDMLFQVGSGGDTNGSDGGDTGYFRFNGLDAGNGGTGGGGRAGQWYSAYPSGFYQFAVECGAGGDGVWSNDGTSDETNYGGGIRMEAGDGGAGNGTLGGEGGQLFLRAGKGGSSDFGSGTQRSGAITRIVGGHGGDYTGTSIGNGGKGGELFIYGGSGGSSSSSSSGTDGGDGGDITIAAGGGGVATSQPARNGDGGDLNLVAGSAYQYWIAGNGGSGGDVLIQGGFGSNNTGIAYGGDVTIEPGQGFTGNGNLFINTLPTSGTGTTHLARNTATGAIYTTTIPASSDKRLKTINETITNTVDKLKTLQAYNWSFNEYSKEIFDIVDTEEKHIGLLAQDVIKVFPELVVELEGKNGDSYLGIDYKYLTPILVEAIKEQQSEIEELKSIAKKQQEQIDKLLEINNLK